MFIVFLKEKMVTTILLILAIVTIEIYLIAYQVDIFMKIYIPIVIMLMYIIGLTIEYLVKSRYYKDFLYTLDELKEKYLIAEIIRNPSFWEGKILKNSLEQIDKSMIESINKYKYMRRRL